MKGFCVSDHFSLALRRSSHRVRCQIDFSDEISQRTTLSGSHLRNIRESKVTFLSGQVRFRDLFTGYSIESHVLCKHETCRILVRKY